MISSLLPAGGLSSPFGVNLIVGGQPISISPIVILPLTTKMISRMTSNAAAPVMV